MPVAAERQPAEALALAVASARTRFAVLTALRQALAEPLAQRTHLRGCAERAALLVAAYLLETPLFLAER
jgi:hypothetical protein